MVSFNTGHSHPSKSLLLNHLIVLSKLDSFSRRQLVDQLPIFCFISEPSTDFAKIVEQRYTYKLHFFGLRVAVPLTRFCLLPTLSLKKKNKFLFFIFTCPPSGARLPVLGPFHMGAAPVVFSYVHSTKAGQICGLYNEKHFNMTTKMCVCVCVSKNYLSRSPCKIAILRWKVEFLLNVGQRKKVTKLPHFDHWII